MGCSHSKVENKGPVRRSKDRLKLMKQLVRRRPELAAAHVAYLHALRNTGATLRYFAEVESALAQGPPEEAAASPSPPPEPSVASSMPPSPRPPPPLPFSPVTIRKMEREDDELRPPPLVFSPIRLNIRKMRNGEDDSVDHDDSDTDSCSTPLPPPPPPGIAWEDLDPFNVRPSDFPSPFAGHNDVQVASQVTVDENNWVETNTELDGGDDESVLGNAVHIVSRVELNPARSRAPGDDKSSTVNGVTKRSDSSVAAWRSKKSLVGIAKEIDEYFLKAAASGSDVVTLLDSAGGRPEPVELEAKKGNMCPNTITTFFEMSIDPTLEYSLSCRGCQHSSFQRLQGKGLQRFSPHFLGAGHSNPSRLTVSPQFGILVMPLDIVTMAEKLLDQEQKLYKLVKDEKSARLQYKRCTSLLQKLESGEHDKLHAERVHDTVEELQTQIISLDEAMTLACLSISKILDEELYPQIIELSAGLVHLWINMYEYHQVQNHIAQQTSFLGNRPGSEPTSDTHFHATSQLEVEISRWHRSLCNLITLQREYISTLNQWIKLTESLPDDEGLMKSSSGIRSLSEELQHAIERLPEKVAAEAIKTFMSVIHSIVVQQSEERQLKKKSDNMEIKFQNQLEKHSETAMQNSTQTPVKNDSVAKNEMKLDAFRKQVEEEKARYLNSVKASRENNLQTSLPNVFHALMGFSGVCVQASVDAVRLLLATQEQFCLQFARDSCLDDCDYSL